MDKLYQMMNKKMLQLRSSIPEDGAKLPELVRDYIFGDPDFFNEEGD